MDKTHVVVTYYREITSSKRIMHAYGPYTEAQAKRERRAALAEYAQAVASGDVPAGAEFRASACRMWTPPDH